MHAYTHNGIQGLPACAVEVEAILDVAFLPTLLKAVIVMVYLLSSSTGVSVPQRAIVKHHHNWRQRCHIDLSETLINLKAVGDLISVYRLISL